MAGTLLLDRYLASTGKVGIPIQYMRWSLVGAVSALLGRKVWVQLGPDTLYPNTYIFFIDLPGSSKSRAMSLGKKYLKAAGYSKFSADKTSRSQFLTDLGKSNLAQEYSIGDDNDIILNGSEDPCEVAVWQGEAGAFLGQKDLDFLETLTDLWDCDRDEFVGSYRQATSYHIVKPVINLLLSTNPTKLITTLGENAINGGFLSRCLCINAPNRDPNFEWPDDELSEIDRGIVDELVRISSMSGRIIPTPAAKRVIQQIWNTAPPIPDRRFDYYMSRRSYQLLKLCMGECAMRNTLSLSPDIVIYCNTMLHAAEIRMPVAIGEFGRSRYADVHQMILEILTKAKRPMRAELIYKMIATELDKGLRELLDILGTLVAASKVQQVQVGKNTTMYLPLIEAKTEWNPDLLDYSVLYDEERPGVITPKPEETDYARQQA